MDHIQIRRLKPADVDLWRAIRLEALREAPVAFGQTLEHALAQPPESFAKTLESPNPIVVALAGERPVGSAGLYVIDGAKTTHRGMLWGMYVTSGFRRQGLAERLIRAVLAEAPAGIAQVHLRVVTENVGAYRLYRRLGFVTYGVEPRALRYDGRDWDETMMVLLLDGARGAGIR